MRYAVALAGAMLLGMSGLVTTAKDAAPAASAAGPRCRIERPGHKFSRRERPGIACPDRQGLNPVTTVRTPPPPDGPAATVSNGPRHDPPCCKQ